MSPQALRELWRHSALPVLALLVGLLAVGIWLQARALRVQGAPLVVEVTAEKESGGQGGEEVGSLGDAGTADGTIA